MKIITELLGVGVALVLGTAAVILAVALALAPLALVCWTIYAVAKLFAH